MQYRTMKKSGDSLSVLGFGMMRLPKKGRRIDEERATKQIRYAIDHGVNYLHTAMSYGGETFLGRVLAGGYREKVKISTNVPLMRIKKKEDLDLLLDLQLKNLQTDHIDYYLFHALSPSSWKRLKGLDVDDFIEKAKKDGRIRNIGFSCHSGTLDFKEVVDGYDWDLCQIQFNILDETNQAGKEGLLYAASKGMGIVIMEPLRGGQLAKTPPKEIQDIWDEADVRRTPAEWGLRWIWNHPEVTVVLSGMNDERHIEENIRTASEALPGSLTEKELALVARVKDVYANMKKVPCTGCHYCLPCPEGVNIPSCFECYNNLTLGSPMIAKMMYIIYVGGGIDGSGTKGYASKCKGCNKCVQVCTQHIDIPSELKKVSRTLETPEMKLVGLIFRPAFGTYTRLDLLRNQIKARK